jgi:hypothetical protein
MASPLPATAGSDAEDTTAPQPQAASQNKADNRIRRKNRRRPTLVWNSQTKSMEELHRNPIPSGISPPNHDDPNGRSNDSNLRSTKDSNPITNNETERPSLSKPITKQRDRHYRPLTNATREEFIEEERR